MTKGENNRSLLVVAIIAVIVLALRFIWFLLPQRIGQVDPHINLVEDRARQITERQRQQQINAFVAVTEGEVFRTEERIREATALATATSLFAASESLSKHLPATVTDLLIGINNAGLMPPGLQPFDSDGNIVSSHAKLVVRYRPDPLGIEVVSLARVPLDGPALLVRVPADGTTKEGATLYVATGLEQTKVLPTPFAPEAEIFALGFASEPLRAAKLPKPSRNRTNFFQYHKRNEGQGCQTSLNVQKLK